MVLRRCQVFINFREGAESAILDAIDLGASYRIVLKWGLDLFVPWMRRKTNFAKFWNLEKDLRWSFGCQLTSTLAAMSFLRQRAKSQTDSRYEWKES